MIGGLEVQIPVPTVEMSKGKTPNFWMLLKDARLCLVWQSPPMCVLIGKWEANVELFRYNAFYHACELNSVVNVIIQYSITNNIDWRSSKSSWPNYFLQTDRKTNLIIFHGWQKKHHKTEETESPFTTQKDTSCSFIRAELNLKLLTNHWSVICVGPMPSYSDDWSNYSLEPRGLFSFYSLK